MPTNLMKEAHVAASVFKSLRDRLKKVSEKLEDELEAQLEAELAASMAETGDDAPPEGDVADARPGRQAAEAEAGERDTGETGAAETEADETEPGEGAPDASRADVTAASKTESAEKEHADAGPSDAAPDAPEPRGDRPEEPPPSAPQRPTSSDSERATSDAQATRAPQATEEATPAEAKPKPPKPKQQITGRRVLSDEEISARLERELGEAVESQKEMEQTVRAGGGRLTRYTINEDVLEEILWDLEVALLESDVALPVIEAIKESVKDQLLSMSVGGRDPSDVVEKVLRTAVRRVLNVGATDFDAFVRGRIEEGRTPVVVMFVGVNGTGKTTSIARMAHRLKQQGISSVMAAGDTFRAGAIEQLSQHGDKLGVRVIKHGAGADPAAVAYDAIEHAKARNKDVVLLDTAGRMQTNRNLMDEMDKIRRVAKPDMTIFVGDSLAGNDAVEQARQFDEVVDIDGAILTKVDVDAKGGAALSVAYTINKPLLFIGVGQDYPDLEPFDADKMVARLFGSEADE